MDWRNTNRSLFGCCVDIFWMCFPFKGIYDGKLGLGECFKQKRVGFNFNTHIWIKAPKVFFSRGYHTARGVNLPGVSKCAESFSPGIILHAESISLVYQNMRSHSPRVSYFTRSQSPWCIELCGVIFPRISYCVEFFEVETNFSGLREYLQMINDHTNVQMRLRPLLNILYKAVTLWILKMDPWSIKFRFLSRYSGYTATTNSDKFPNIFGGSDSILKI